ncbi:DEAD/DEAH box helicase [endosymbiont GvMRE of Glomus versiforme]|uniref:DEAD/DEAH box helicase n=1 Tax=endosymbiont GvMRE of Glomus versiforme TaxID=2039283 RepID=UPI000ED355B6|nr:DEAD/DEAH box helicase [endosymbiont GvMRE of Glomus versiforme]RHZ37329.1 Helicase SNF2 [endosymbiont GvMRE of Glomus versiforme]
MHPLPEFKIEIIQIEDDKIFLKTNYSWAICLNAEYGGKPQSYYLAKSLLNFRKLKKFFPDYAFPVGEWQIKKTNFQLRPYQEKDVNFLSPQKSVGIFNEMRTGKTPIALTIFQRWKAPNLIIICPSILQAQWQEAIENWLNQPAYLLSYLSLTERQIIYQKFCQEKNWIIIISKDIFKIDSKYFRGLRKKKKPIFCSLIDEAHYLRNYQSQQSKSLYTLKDSEYKMVLTGTPLVNHSSDIFGILKFLQPEIYTSYWKFAEEFFLVRETEIPKASRTFKIKRVLGFKNEKMKQELQQRLNQISVARKQKEVLPWLPLIEQQEIKLLMEKNQQLLYSRWTQKWDKNYPLEFLAKLKTLTLFPPALIHKRKDKRDFLTEEDRKLLKDCQGSKISYLVDFCQANSQQGLLIFSTRTETFLEPLAQALQKTKLKVALLTGKISHQQRIEFISAFQQQKIKILLCNIQSAGLGLNLSRADIAIFADRSYSPADNEQAEARFLPTKESENPKTRLIIDLVCKGTIDEKILNLLKRKKDITKIITANPEYLL